MAITRNQGENRIIWLDDGTEARGFLHIIQSHAHQFEEYFGVYMNRDIAKFIFNAISKKQIYNSWDEAFGSKFYVYEFGLNFLKVLVNEDGYIVTAFPSKTSNFKYFEDIRWIT